MFASRSKEFCYFEEQFLLGLVALHFKFDFLDFLAWSMRLSWEFCVNLCQSRRRVAYTDSHSEQLTFFYFLRGKHLLLKTWLPT